MRASICLIYSRMYALHMCMYVCSCTYTYLPCPHPGHGVSLQGVVMCFGLCARGQVKTVLNVLQDFDERIQESEQSWQIGAWRVRAR